MSTVATVPEGTVNPYALSHLDSLESEAVHIFREVAGEFERPVILFSGGKDSILMLHLALKAFAPAPIPFTLLHVDTGHNFPEVLEYRDRTVEKHGLRLHVASVQEYIDSRQAPRAPRRHPQPAADRPAHRGHPAAPLRRRLRRRTARRGEGPGQGARLLPARRVLPVGPAPPAPRAVAALQRPPRHAASTSGSSRSPTGPSWTSGSTSSVRASSSRRSTSPTSARSSAAPACG